MINIKAYGLIFLLVIISSCTKVINIKTGNASGQIDIEANVIDTAGPQTIIIRENVPFTNTNTYPALSGASVMISDTGGNAFKFTEGPSGTYTNAQLTGIPNASYKMTVSTGGITYFASSRMPANTPLDSITSENDPVSNGKKQRKEIVVHYSDPAGIPNYYHFILYVNDIQVKSVFAFDDEFNDGRPVNIILRETLVDIFAGDKVTVEMQCVDHPIYLYWLTLAQQGDNGPAGSVAPSNPPSNINPVSLGYFSAHTKMTKTLIAK